MVESGGPTERFSRGYVFTRRIDGAQFINGIWPIEIGDVTGKYVGSPVPRRIGTVPID